MVRTKIFSIFVSTLLGAGAFAAGPNTDALKVFQAQGKDIVAGKEDLKPLRLPTGNCLNVDGDAVKAGTNVNMLKCSDSVKQLWRLDDSGRLVNSGLKCLNLDGKVKTMGANVTIQDCNESENQRWTIAGSRIKNDGGQCLSADGDAKASGRNVSVAKCNDSPNQEWKF